MDNFKLHTLVVGYLDTNCYILETNSLACVIIDPGGDHDKIIDYMAQNKLKPSLIINTHGHADHILANLPIKNIYGCTIYMHEADREFPENDELNGSYMLGRPNGMVPADILVKNHTKIVMDELVFNVIHTPGHTPGSMCLLINDIMFSGDTLFRGSIGRCDLAGGNESAMEKSLKQIIKLDRAFNVLPGHGEPSTLEEEFAANPFILKLK